MLMVALSWALPLGLHLLHLASQHEAPQEYPRNFALFWTTSARSVEE